MIFFILILFFPLSLSANEEKTTFVSYEDAARIALSENPDLASLRHQEMGAKLRSNLALAPNDPVFSINKNNLTGISPFSDEFSTSYTINYTLGFPGKSFYQSASLRHQAESISEQGLSKEIDLLIALSNNYIAFAVNKFFFDFLTDEKKKTEELEKLVEKKFSAGQAARVDLLNARVAIVSEVQLLLVNRNEYDQLLTSFLGLIKKPGNKEFKPLIPNEVAIPFLKKNLDELQSLMLKNRHLIRSQKFQLDSVVSAEHLATMAALPDLQLNGAMTWYRNPAIAQNPGVGRDYSIGLGIAVPLFYPFSELTAARAAGRDRAAAKSTLDGMLLQSVSDLETIYTNFQASQKELDSLIKLVLPAAKEAYDLMLLTYSVGKADFFSVNQSRQVLTQARKDELTKKQALAQLYNQLIAQVGCDFDKTEGPHVCK